MLELLDKFDTMSFTSPRRICLMAGLLLGLPLFAHAQNYDLSWFKIAGGGGTSTGGTFSVSGTIGQPDAGHMSGGNYTLDGGFWGLIAAVQTPGSPLLTITGASPNAIISWPAPSTGFVLQQNSDVNVTNGWSNVGISVVVTNGQNTVTVPANLARKFYRLKQ
jgi:hypothetical protein